MSLEGEQASAPQNLSDPKAIRALAHPVRLALIELLTIEGPLTATQASEHVDESPSSCSFHFRQLAKYGFVEEAEQVAGRSRPWRISRLGARFSGSQDDAEVVLAAQLLSRTLHDRYFAQWRRWLDTSTAYPAEWTTVAGSSETIWWVTPDELRELNRSIETLVYEHRDRVLDPVARPVGSLPVQFVALAFPIQLPKEDADGVG